MGLSYNTVCPACSYRVTCDLDANQQKNLFTQLSVLLKCPSCAQGLELRLIRGSVVSRIVNDDTPKTPSVRTIPMPQSPGTVEPMRRDHAQSSALPDNRLNGFDSPVETPPATPRPIEPDSFFGELSPTTKTPGSTPPPNSPNLASRSESKSSAVPPFALITPGSANSGPSFGKSPSMSDRYSSLPKWQQVGIIVAVFLVAIVILLWPTGDRRIQDTSKSPDEAQSESEADHAVPHSQQPPASDSQNPSSDK